MKLKYIILQLYIVIQLLKVHHATGLGIVCEYKKYDRSSHPAYRYGCKLKEIRNDQRGIFGIHQEGKSDDDVLFMHHSYAREKKLVIFDSSICEKFRNLEIISLWNVKIETINQDALLKCGELTLLALKNGQISTLPDDLLVNQTKIKSISFEENKIQALSPNILRNLSELYELFISENEIDSLDPNVFHDLISLKMLSLSKNKITILPENIFDSCVNLNELNLSGNKFESINPKLFKNLEKLEVLIMSKNKIAVITKSDFQYLTNLKGLYLNENLIANLESNCFESLQKLTKFGIGSNRIVDLPPKIFSPLQKLEGLGLNTNQLRIIHSDSFGVLQNLRSLYVGNNKMIAFDEKIIENTAINTVDMYENICCGENNIRDKIKLKLKKCFENYQPRAVRTTTSLPPSTAASKMENANSCGKQAMGVGTVVHGTEVKRGSYPWTAALLRENGDFFCGGTLVSNKKVITAAHCIEEKFKDVKLRPRDVTVLLGVHNIKKYVEVGRITAAVKNITVHPDWHPRIQSYDADIAVLELAREVQFDEFIQPICLAQPQSQAALISLGVVVGFGKSEFADVENVARVVNTPIHSYRTCTESSSHESLISHRTICGGYANGTGVCIGDSGSGLIVKYNGAYYLRGIVSSSLYGGLFGCNVHAYSVFTDVTKFYDWILDRDTVKLDNEINRMREALRNAGYI